MKYRFLYLAFVIISAAVSSVFAASSKKKTVNLSAPEAGVMNWKPAINLVTPLHHGRLHGGNLFILGGINNNITNSNSSGVNLGAEYLIMLHDNFGISGGLAYRQQSFTVTTTTPNTAFFYKHFQVPIVLTFLASKYVFLGVGAKYSYLLSTDINGQNVSLSNNKAFNRNGIGFLADISLGWSARSPRLDIQYNYMGGASQTGQNNGTIEVSLKVPLFLTK